jgi:heat shock protein HtpX
VTTDFRQLQARNRRTTWLLLLASFVLLAVVSGVISFVTVGGIAAVAFALIFSFGTTFAAYRASDTIALRSTRAQPADPHEHARLHNLVEEMAIAAGLPKPRVYVVDDPAPNAFATGKDPEHAAIAATTGLIAKLDRSELQGVIAHEMAHIRNNDIRVMTVAVATAGAIALIADVFWHLLFFGGARGRSRSRDGNGVQAVLTIIGFLFVTVLAPLAASLLRAAISRSREGLADASAVELTRHPEGLRRALEKLDADVTVVRRTSHATSHLWIEAPDDHERHHKGRRFNDMFNTHPPLRERIDALRKMEGLSPYEGPTEEQRAAARDTGGGATAQRPQSWSEVASSASLTELAATHSDEPANHAEAGWFADPTSQHRLRWWDGHAWSNFTSR